MILEQLSGLDFSPELLERMVDALLPLLLNSASGKKRRGRGDETTTIRVLYVLSALWTRQVKTRQLQGSSCFAQTTEPSFS